MKIYLKTLTLTNFKGIRSQSISFEQVTNIYGRNEAGKTTLMDAFLWLFFGKDSSDRKDFEIKTLDENNVPFHKLDHEVTAVIDVDGQEITIRRSLREKWTKKRGSSSEEFTGHETAFFWNDVPMKEGEYQVKISSLLDEKIFKLITNTTYFNSLKWQDRRAVLLQMAGVINDTEVIDSIANSSNEKDIALLTAALKQGKSMDEFKRELAVKKKKIKDELELLPSRIDEAGRSLPEEKDYSEIDRLIEGLANDIESVDGLMQNKSAATKKHQEHVTDLINKKQNICRLLLDMEFNIKNEFKAKQQRRLTNILGLQNDVRSLEEKIKLTRQNYTSIENVKKELLNEQTGLRDKWTAVDAEKLVFDDAEFCCPACKRAFEAADVDAKKLEITANFNQDKSKRLTAIKERGITIAEQVKGMDVKLGNLKAEGEATNAEIANLKERLQDLQTENERLTANEADELQKAIDSNEDYNLHMAEVKALDAEINAPFVEDNTALRIRRNDLVSQQDKLKEQLADKGLREKQLQRIEELNNQEAKMAQELATLEGIEYAVEQFTKAKMDTLEARINGRFQIVRFKMFETQINGGQVEACTTLIKGVPYSDANTAAKIQAGLDIINTLSEHYGIQAPVWIDNRESVTDLPDSEAQIINLIVSPTHKKLTVGEKQMALAMA